MENSFNDSTPLPQNEDQNIQVKTDVQFRAKITQSIGHGEDAKNSLIYVTLKYTFISGIVLTVIVAVNHWYDKSQSDEVTNEHFIESLVRGWQLIIPIITLSLGYAFGKAEK